MRIPCSCKNIIEIRDSQLNEQQQQQCAPRDHVFLLKMHKSGGDALQNMFMRRGFLRQHNFVLPKQGIFSSKMAVV